MSSSPLTQEEDEATLSPIYSNHQTHVLQSLYYVTPTFSLLGSLTIIYVFCKRGRSMKDVNETFIRLMVGYAVMDVIQTIVWMILGPWATPEGNVFVEHATGSIATCNVKGIFMNFTFGLMLYSTSIACYHAMKVSFEWPDFFIAKGFEPVMHFLSWFWPTFVGFPSVFYDNVNPYDILPGTCWVTHLGSVRGDKEKAMSVQRVFGFTTFFMSFVLTSGAFFLLFWKARTIEQRMSRYAHGRGSNSNNSNTHRVSLPTKTGRQGMRYSMAFLLCNVSWPFVVFVDRNRNDSGDFFFPLAVYTLLLTPLQGFVNAILFLESHRSVFDQGGPLHCLTKLSSSFRATRSSSLESTTIQGPDHTSSTYH